MRSAPTAPAERFEQDRATITVDQPPADVEAVVATVGECLRDGSRIGVVTKLREEPADRVRRNRRHVAHEIATDETFGVSRALLGQAPKQASGGGAITGIEGVEPGGLGRGLTGHAATVTLRSATLRLRVLVVLAVSRWGGLRRARLNRAGRQFPGPVRGSFTTALDPVGKR